MHVELVLSVNALTRTALIVAGCTLLFSLGSLNGIAQKKSKRLQKPQVKIISCKTDDEDCFFRAAEICRKANVTATKSLDLFGIVITATSYSEIRGGRKGFCTLYFRNEKTDIKFSEELVRKMKESGLTQQEIEQKELKANKDADATEKTEGVCTFKTEHLVALLKKWKNGVFSSNDWKDGNCRGTMFDQTSWKIEQ